MYWSISSDGSCANSSADTRSPAANRPHYIPVGVRQTRERRRCHNVMGARLACFAAVTPAFAIAVLPDDQRADALSLLMRSRARLPSDIRTAQDATRPADIDSPALSAQAP